MSRFLGESRFWPKVWLSTSSLVLSDALWPAGGTLASACSLLGSKTVSRGMYWLGPGSLLCHLDIITLSVCAMPS